MQPRAQSAMEFISVYGMVFLIIAVALTILAIFTFIPKSTAPPHCDMYGVLKCVSITYTNATNNSATLALAVASTQPGVVNISTFNVTVSSPGGPSNTISGNCNPTLLYQGSTSICRATVPSQNSKISSLLIGTTRITAGYCATGPGSFRSIFCQAAPGYLFAGSFQVQVTPVVIISLLPYVPITLTNSQNIATQTQFQQQISFNPALYSQYEATDLGNIRFYAGKQTPSNLLYSWCESGCNTSSSTATFWVKLSNSIPATSSTVINMTFTNKSTEYDSNYAGKAPTVVVTTPVSSYETSGGNENGGSNTIVLSVGGNHNSFLCIPAGNENIPAVVTGNTCTITSPPWAPGEAAGAMLGISSTVGVPVNYTSPVYGFSGGSPFDFNFNVITPDAFVVLLASCSGVTCNNGGIPTNQGYPNTTVNLNALNSSCTLSQNYVSSDAQSNILVYICSSVNAGSYSISVNNQGYTFMSAYVYSPPQIVNYATYDNGANVFPTLYQNFAGTSCPSGWSCPSGGVNNGYISSSIKTQNANFYYLSSNVLDVYASYQNLPASMSMNGLSIGYQFSAPLCSGGHCTLPSPAQFGWSESPTCSNYICPYSNYSGYNSAVRVTSGVSQVLSTYYNTSTNTYDFEVNYGQKSSLPSYLPEEPLYSKFRIIVSPTPNSVMNTNWVRIRAYPPNGVMPSTSFGFLVH